jgi:alpha-tubulin suppressor-like RCC1 family protein
VCDLNLNLNLNLNLRLQQRLYYFKQQEVHVTGVATSSLHSCAVASDGSAHTWGAGVPGALGHLKADEMMDHMEYTPCMVDDLTHVQVVSVACGNRHTVALTSDGSVHTWGAGEFGQLGHGDVDDDENSMYKMQYDSHTGKVRVTVRSHAA